MGLLSGMRNFDGAFTQEIGKRNIKYGFQSPEHMRFGDFPKYPKWAQVCRSM